MNRQFVIALMLISLFGLLVFQSSKEKKARALTLKIQKQSANRPQEKQEAFWRTDAKSGIRELWNHVSA